MEKAELLEINQEGDTFDSNAGIWKIHTAPKIKLFLWKIFRGALPVGEGLAVRNITSTINCKRCNSPESITHLFLHCGLAQKVWKSVPFSIGVNTRGLVDLPGCWNDLCRLVCFPPSGITAGPLAPWILWHFWLARNDYVFNHKETPAELIITKATASAREWLCAQIPESPTKPPTQSSSAPNKLPNSTLLQLAGLGWIVGEGTEKVSILAHCHYVNSPLVAEGLALREALQFCFEKNIRQLRCETDSLLLVNALNSGQQVTEIYRG